MKTAKTRKPGIERRAVWFAITACLSIVTIHLLVTLLRRVVPGLPLAAWPITYGAIGLAAMASLAFPGFANRLPVWLDGTVRSHPVRVAAFSALALLAIVQTARLTTHMVDPDTPWWILTSNEFWTEHECGTAYFHAVELHDRGEKNIYHADHYPVLNREMTPHSEIQGMKVEDSYQYPPQFLLLPKLLLLTTDHYPTIRVLWFALQFIGVLGVLLLFARWVGGQHGRWMGMLSPIVIVSPAALYAYQYTQFHFIAIALAVAGMVAFEKQRNALGGALLAGAVLGKIFPGFLVILLIAERRWKAVAWTAGFGAAFTALALAVLGTDPFVAFFNYHLPRLYSFAAFSFLDTWPEVRFELLTANLSPYGQIMKLGEMGLPGMVSTMASGVNTLCTIALIGLSIRAAKRLDTNVRRAQVWLSILGLASLMSPAAWGDYVTIPAIWLLTTFAMEMRSNWRLAVLFGICGIFFYFLIGLVPVGGFPAQGITFAFSTLSFVLLVGLMAGSILRKSTAYPVPQRRSSGTHGFFGGEIDVVNPSLSFLRNSAK